MRPDDVSGHGCSSLPSAQAAFRRQAPAWRLAKTIAGRTPLGHSYSVAFHQVEFYCMPLKSDTVEAAARTLRLGDPFAPETTLGPLNNEGVAMKMDEHVADAVAHGARVVIGGKRADGFPTRLYYPATILDGVEPKMRVSLEETFGPVAPVIKFGDEAQALAMANDSPYGLLGAVYTKDLSRALRFADGLEMGWVNINESSNYWEAHLPFGGRAGKRSGIGRVGGRFALEQMTDLKTIVIEVEAAP